MLAPNKKPANNRHWIAIVFFVIAVFVFGYVLWIRGFLPL